MSITDAELSMIENLPHTVDEGRLIAALREARADNARNVAAHMATSAERDRLRAFVDDVLREASEYPPIGTAWIAWAHEKHLGEG